MYISGMVAPLEVVLPQYKGELTNRIFILANCRRFQIALSALWGKFWGKKYHRLLKGVRYALITMTIYGIYISIIFFKESDFIFQIFSSDKETLIRGIDYLKILAFSQAFMITEALVGGAFNGLGKTIPQSVVSLTFNFLRIPMAYFLIPHYGLNGIWLAITISSIFKGTVIYLWYKIYIKYSNTFKIFVCQSHYLMIK